MNRQSDWIARKRSDCIDDGIQLFLISIAAKDFGLNVLPRSLTKLAIASSSLLKPASALWTPHIFLLARTRARAVVAKVCGCKTPPDLDRRQSHQGIVVLWSVRSQLFCRLSYDPKATNKIRF